MASVAFAIYFYLPRKGLFLSLKHCDYPVTDSEVAE